MDSLFATPIAWPEITGQDVLLIGFLAFLEGILSIDNALVLAIIAKRLPKELRRKALTYGLAGAVVFRLLSLLIVTQLIQWTWVKFVGGGYLLFISLKHFVQTNQEEDADEAQYKGGAHFWRVVVTIELMDLAFAVDSILAAVALTSKFYLVFTGGMLGVIMMRLAASGFIRLLEKFPRFEDTAYLLVFTIGVKVILEGLKLPGLDFHSPGSPAFWAFWATMLVCILLGFRGKKAKARKK